MNTKVIDILSNVAIGVGGVIFGTSLFFKLRGDDVVEVEEIRVEKLVEETHNIKRTGTGGVNDALADVEDGINNVKSRFKEYSSLDRDGDYVTSEFFDYSKVSTHERETTVMTPDLSIIEEDISKNYVLPQKNNVVIISEDEYFENDWDWYQDVLHYYEDDDVLTDDRDEVLSNKEYYVGDEALDSFGSGPSKKDSVYIAHYGENKLFEIALEPGSYSETILGIETEVFEKIGGYDKNIEKEE